MPKHRRSGTISSSSSLRHYLDRLVCADIPQLKADAQQIVETAYVRPRPCRAFGAVPEAFRGPSPRRCGQSSFASGINQLSGEDTGACWLYRAVASLLLIRARNFAERQTAEGANDGLHLSLFPARAWLPGNGRSAEFAGAR